MRAVRWLRARASRVLLALTVRAAAWQMPILPPPGPVSPRMGAPGATAPLAPRWYWSTCGRCGGQTRPAMPCETCGWLLGSVTPERAATAGIDLRAAEVEMMGETWRARRGEP